MTSFIAITCRMTSLSPIATLLPVKEEGDAATRTKTKLLRAGISCFAELGYHAASTRLIENAAGVKRNLMSYHWGSKEAFWKDCIDCLIGALMLEFRVVDDQAVNVDGRERLRFFVRASIRASAKYPEIHSIMLDEGKRNEDRLAWIVERHVKPMTARVEQLLVDARQMGVAHEIDLPSFYYALVGATSMFTMAPECRMLFGIDPLEDAAVTRHADAIARLLIPDQPFDQSLKVKRRKRS